jgi:hypothetical protein
LGKRADFFEHRGFLDGDGDSLGNEDLSVLGLSIEPGGKIAYRVQ